MALVHQMLIFISSIIVLRCPQGEQQSIQGSTGFACYGEFECFFFFPDKENTDNLSKILKTCFRTGNLAPTQGNF